MRPADELADDEEARRDARHADVERRLVDPEEERVPRAGHREREDEQRRPDDGCCGEKRADDAENQHRRRRVVRGDERQPDGQPERHGDGDGTCGYRLARRA